MDELAGPWPEEVANNVAISKRPLEELELRTIWAMCTSPEAGPKLDYDRLIDRLNGHDNTVSRSLQSAYLANAARPKALRWKNVQGLSVDDTQRFRDRLAALPDADPLIGIIIRAVLAWRNEGPLLADAELEKLAKQKSLSILLARQPNCSEATLLKLDDEQPYAMNNPNFPVARLVERSRSADPAERAQVARAAALPPERIAALARDEHWSVRQAIARRTDLPAKITKLLAEDESEHVRDERPIPPGVKPREPLDELIRGSLDDRRTAAESPTLTPAQAANLVTDKHRDVRAALVRNRALTSEQVASLEHDRDEGVRREWLNYARTEAEMLRAVEQLPDDQLPEFVFMNPSAGVSPTVTVAIAQRGSADTKAALKDFIDLPAEAWRAILYGETPKKLPASSVKRARKPAAK